MNGLHELRQQSECEWTGSRSALPPGEPLSMITNPNPRSAASSRGRVAPPSIPRQRGNLAIFDPANRLGQIQRQRPRTVGHQVTRDQCVKIRLDGIREGREALAVRTGSGRLGYLSRRLSSAQFSCRDQRGSDRNAAAASRDRSRAGVPQSIQTYSAK
jgi:hypothetical protein